MKVLEAIPEASTDTLPLVGTVTVVEDATVTEGDVRSPISDADMSRRVADGEAFILKRLFDADYVKGLYMGVFDRYADVEPTFQKYEWGMDNFWRMDLNPPKAANSKKIQAFYYQFTWNDNSSDLAKVTRVLARYRNRIAGLDPDYGHRPEDSLWAIPLLQHYPIGGGYVSMHQDAAEPQKCVISLTVDKRFEEGGLYIGCHGRQLLIEPMLDPGDAFVFRPDIPHGVAPVDPGKGPIDFRSPTGRWRAATILVPRAERV